MNNEIIMDKFREAMKHLSKDDKDEVSLKLHQNNIRIERDIRFGISTKKVS